MIFTDYTSEHYAAFAASQESLDEIREFVQSALLTTDLGKKAIAGLLLAIEEVVTNIVRHGYLYGPGRLRLRIRATRRIVTITVHDNGRAYEVNFDEKPDAQQLAETGRRGGLGLMLIRKVTDAVDYKRVGDENIITMTKHIGPVDPQRGHRAFSARVATIGMASLILVTLVGTSLLYMRNRGEIKDSFIGRWQEFARAAAASASQHMLNERSDAEFDQLVVGLKQAQPDISYLVIVDAAGQIRAHSEKPEFVHQPYTAPTGTSIEKSGVWNTDSEAGPLFHFGEVMSIDRRTVGSVALGVGSSVLDAQLSSEAWRLVFGALGVIAIGGILVGLVSFFMGRPLRRLGDMLRTAKSQGAVANITPGSAPDEIAEVVTAINEVTEAVARTERQIARRDLAKREMEQAEHLQRALLPLRLPEIPGYETQAAYRMAQHVGGDYYDVIPVDGDEGLWVILVADVAGKGFPAALVMTAIRTAMRLLAPSRRSPVEILQALDEYLAKHHPGGPFVTIACGVLDTRASTLTLASAGHTPVLHRLAGSGSILRINPKGRPVGVQMGGRLSAIALGSQTVSLDEGDSIVLYTDGLTEARDRSGDAFGTERVEETLRIDGASAAATMDAVLSKLNEFSEGGSTEDDVTVLILRRQAKSDAQAKPATDVVQIFRQNIAATF
jgi:serine phosphatase RsbU (regulator of sigma subunit)/anti-sigma regulatory factor (Ser/Thr protein kinase)